MLDDLNNPGNKTAIQLLIFSIIAIFLSGILFGLTYYFMDTIQSSLGSVSCTIPNNVYFSSCQEMFDFTIYKILSLKAILIWFSYLSIFTFVLGILILGYRKGSSPVKTGIMFVLTLIFTYVGILISNLYRQMITNTTFYSIMQPFPIYNKIMYNFPWFVGFIGILSMVLSIINYQRTSVNTDVSDLSY